MKVIRKHIEELISPEYNPRRKLTPNDAEYQKIKRSIETFGYVDPIIFNRRTGHIVGGNQRWQVLKDLGHKEVDAVEVDLDAGGEKALNVALNKISGEWDMELLQEVLQDLSNEGVDITLTGFDSSMLLPPIEDALQEYTGMPEYTSEDKLSYWHIVVHFRNDQDIAEFAKLVKQQHVNNKTKFIWYPEQKDAVLKDLKYE
jgi:hypothetical protein